MRSRKQVKGISRVKSSSPQRSTKPKPKPKPKLKTAADQHSPQPPLGISFGKETSTVVILTLLAVGLVYDFSQGVEVAWVTKHYDLLNTCVGLRARVAPEDAWRKSCGGGSSEPYWWLCPSKSDVDRCCLVLSFFILKFAAGVVLSYLYLGELKYPTTMDFVLFTLFCLATQSSYGVYEAVKTDQRFANIVRLGSASYKSAKHIKTVVKAQVLGFHTIDVLCFSVLNSEVNSVLRQIDVFFAYYPIRQATLKSASLLRNVAFSSDILCDCVATIMVMLAASSNRHDVIYLAWAIMLYRFSRQVLWTFFSVGVDVLRNSMQRVSQDTPSATLKPTKPVKVTAPNTRDKVKVT